MSRPIICLVTNGRMTPPDIDRLAAAARAGVDLIQIREPGLDDRALLAMVRAAVSACAGTPARIVVNERLDIALAAGAAGVHLQGTSFPASRARELAPGGFLVGRSVHTLEAARDAERQGGADYLIFGTVFASASKPHDHPVAGTDALAAVCAGVASPVIAIGGMSPDTAPLVARAGAAGLAAIGIFARTGDVVGLVTRLRKGFDTRSEAV